MTTAQTVQPEVKGFFDPATFTISYVVSDPRTAALCDVAQASASSLVVSSATLVRELLGGRTRLGKVKDLGAMARATQKTLFR